MSKGEQQMTPLAKKLLILIVIMLVVYAIMNIMGVGDAKALTLLQ